MKFKKDINSMTWDIQSRAQGAAMGMMQQMAPYGSPMGPMADIMSQAIARAVAEGFRVIMENQYTDDDFENDLGLKP